MHIAIALSTIHTKMKAAINSVVSYYPTINSHCKCFDNWIFLLICPSWLILPEQKEKTFFTSIFFCVFILSFSFWFYLMEKRREKFISLFVAFGASTYWRLWFSTLAFHAYYIENATDMFAFFALLSCVLFSFTYLVELCLKLSFLFLVTMKCWMRIGKGWEFFKKKKNLRMIWRITVFI